MSHLLCGGSLKSLLGRCMFVGNVQLTTDSIRTVHAITTLTVGHLTISLLRTAVVTAITSTNS